MGTLYLFDFDDTLFKTKNTVTVRHPETHEEEYRLTSESLAEMVQRHLEAKIPFNKLFTHEDFHTVREPQPIPQTHQILRNVTQKIYNPSIPTTSSVYILTARESSSIPGIENILGEYGFPSIPIITSDMVGGDSTADKKKNAVRSLLNTGRYNGVEFFDDASSNLSTVEELTGEFPNVRFRLRLVGYGKQIVSSNKMSTKNSSNDTDILDDLRIAQQMDDFKFFSLADKFDNLCVDKIKIGQINSSPSDSSVTYSE